MARTDGVIGPAGRPGLRQCRAYRGGAPDGGAGRPAGSLRPLLTAAAALLLVWATGTPAMAAGPQEALTAGHYAQAYRQSLAVGTAASQVLAATAASDEAVYGGGSASQQLAWLGRARRAAERATKLDPSNAEAYVQLARARGEIARRAGVLQSLNVVGQLKDLFHRALSIDPHNADALVGLALWNLELTQHGVGWLYGADKKKVLPLLRQGVAAAPMQINLRVEYASALRTLGRRQAADEQLRKALRLPASNAVDRAEQARARALLAGGS